MATSSHVAVLKVALGLVGLCLAAYILGPPLYWHFKEDLAAVSHSSSSSCPSCVCDCSSQLLLSIPPDCAKRDPEVSEAAEKNFAEQLTEELKLWEVEALERQQHADVDLLEAKKMASQYQKEADKCNSGMGTCEEAREKAEAALVAQKKLTAMWEMSARQRGWKEGVGKTLVQSQSIVQAM